MRHNTFAAIRRFVAATLVAATLINPLAANVGTKNIAEYGNAGAEVTAEMTAEAAAAEASAAVTADGNVTVTTIPAEAVAAEPVATMDTRVASAAATLQTAFPEGTYWTNEVKYVSNCTINGARYIYTGYGCVAFALQFADTVYGGNASYTKTTTCAVSEIESGDIVRVPSASGGHTYVVLSVDATGATIAEANYNSSVHWGRHVSNAELANNIYVLSRNAA